MGEEVNKAKPLKWRPYGDGTSACAPSIFGYDWIVVEICGEYWALARGTHSPTEKYRTKKSAKDRAELLHQIEWLMLCEKWQKRTRAKAKQPVSE